MVHPSGDERHDELGGAPVQALATAVVDATAPVGRTSREAPMRDALAVGAAPFETARSLSLWNIHTEPIERLLFRR